MASSYFPFFPLGSSNQCKNLCVYQNKLFALQLVVKLGGAEKQGTKFLRLIKDDFVRRSDLNFFFLYFYLNCCVASILLQLLISSILPQELVYAGLCKYVYKSTSNLVR